jgi:hypothetical protein
MEQVPLRVNWLNRISTGREPPTVVVGVLATVLQEKAWESTLPKASVKPVAPLNQLVPPVVDSGVVMLTLPWPVVLLDTVKAWLLGAVKTIRAASAGEAMARRPAAEKPAIRTFFMTCVVGQL